MHAYVNSKFMLLQSTGQLAVFLSVICWPVSQLLCLDTSIITLVVVRHLDSTPFVTLDLKGAVLAVLFMKLFMLMM